MKMPKQLSIYTGLGILVILIAAYALTLAPQAPEGEVAIVTRGDITEEVFITGSVKAARMAALSFDRGGTVRTLPFSVGTSVGIGAALASLENGSEYAAVSESRALVAIAEAKLAETKRGTREEELRLKEAEAHKAEVSLQGSEGKVFGVLTDAHSAAEESLNRYATPFFGDDDTLHPRLAYVSGTQEAFDAEAKRVRAGQAVSRLQKAVQSGPASLPALESAGAGLRVIQDLFITLGQTLRDGSIADAATLADYRARVTSARNALGAALTSLQNLINALRDGAAELERARQALALARAGSTPEAVARAEQELAQARAGFRSAEALFEKTLLRAPFRGTIASKGAEVGETVQAGKTIMEFLGTDGFAIEANVPEADVTKFERGDAAEVTLDAYGEEIVFPARVSLIEPASREIEGVPTYKTTFVFETQDARFRSGLTANITIKKLARASVHIAPSRAIFSEDGKQFATRLLPDGTTEKVEVKIGARSGSREVEIVEGLNEGDRIVIPIVK